MILAVSCNDFGFILRILSYLFSLLQWIIPFVLIILIAFDLMKIVVNGDEKGKKDIGNKIVKRVIYALILFLIPMLVKMLFSMLGSSSGISSTSWISCFNEFFG